MANSTNFYSHHDRKVYHSKSVFDPESIPDTLVPGTIKEDITLTGTTHHIVIDFGESRRITHFFIKQNGMTSVRIEYSDDDYNTHGSFAVADSNMNNFAIPSSDFDKRKIYSISQTTLNGMISEVTARSVRMSLRAGSTNSKLDTLIFMEELSEFPDGAFKNINPAWEHRTQGHHQLISGRKVRYSGLGVPKLKMQLDADFLPYDEDAATETIAGGVTVPNTPRLDSETLEQLENIFLYHEHFVFADSLDLHPERIVVASFEDNMFDFPYSSPFRKAGHDASVVVCEV